MRRTAAYIICLSALWLIGCSATQEMNVVIKMMPAQEDHFRKNVIGPFEKENNVKVNVTSLKSIKELPDAIKKGGPGGGMHLAKVPFDMTKSLVSQGLIAPIDGLSDKGKIEDLKDEYFLMDLTKFGDRYYYFPRKFETRTMLYLKSQVKDAVENWEEYRHEIDSRLKKHNRVGLPTDYALEKDPNEWDYFDVFVAGYYWKSKVILGKKIPRIAHRAKQYPGTAQRLVDRAYQFGASQEHVLAMRGKPIADVFAWEALYAQEKVYNPKMYREKWSGSDIWRGFESGDVFLSFMTQIDAFFVHGAGTDSIPGYLKNPEDMGVAIMPQAVSLELSQGQPSRVGKRSITTGGWWWGVPSNTPNPELSFKLAKHITNTKNQIEGCSGFGMIPVRRDILSELGLMFGGGWVSDVFHVASKQLVENKYTIIPLIDEYGDITNNYIDAFYEIAVRGNVGTKGEINTDNIEQQLESIFVPIQQGLLGGRYPTNLKASLRSPKPQEKFRALNENMEENSSEDEEEEEDEEEYEEEEEDEGDEDDEEYYEEEEG